MVGIWQRRVRITGNFIGILMAHFPPMMEEPEFFLGGGDAIEYHADRWLIAVADITAEGQGRRKSQHTC